MNEKTFGLEHQSERISFEDAFDELQGILGVLTNLGLTVPDYCRDDEMVESRWNERNAFPIAEEGIDGVRVTPLHNGHWRVWFTNGFESPSHPDREKIVTALKDAGFDVVQQGT